MREDVLGGKRRKRGKGKEDEIEFIKGPHKSPSFYLLTYLLDLLRPFPGR